MRFKNLLRILPICLSLPAFSQIQFEKGYLITNEGQRKECLIRNADWDNNPISFKYKLSDESVLDADVDDVKEFGITGDATYVRATVKVDESPTNVNMLSRERNPVWLERRAFLKKIVSGSASLFFYKEGHIKQYLYQKSDSSIVSLIFKRYHNENGEVSTNFGYRQQLWNDVNCGSVSREAIARVNYTDSDLIRFFQQYNSCTDPAYRAQKEGKHRETFNIRITPGADFTMLKTEHFTRVNPDKGDANSISFRIGAELEYVAGFNKGKWALIVEPSFQYYKFPLIASSLNIDVNYWSVDLPVGIRHSFFLANGSKLFVNGLYVPVIKNKQFKDDREMEITMGSNAAFGVGLAKGRLSGEVRYYLGRYVESSYIKIDPSFSKATLILGYKIFSK